MASDDGAIVIPIQVETRESEMDESSTAFYSEFSNNYETREYNPMLSKPGARVSLSQRSPLASPTGSRPGSRQQKNSNQEFDGYLNALLADLQTTVSSPPGSLSRSSGYSSTYNGTSTGLAKQNETFDYNVERSAVAPNRDALRETTSTKTLYRSNSPLIRNTGNMSELDSLLQDLSATSKYSQNSPVSVSRELVYNGNRPNSRSSLGSHQERHTTGEFLEDLANGDETDGKTRITVERKIHRTFLGPAASPATRELDDLMASLSDAKIRDREESSLVQQPKKAQQLDSMLGNLQASMDKSGVSATQKGVCAACNKPIVGQVVTALGKTWHPEHFCCAHCRSELGSKNFYEREGQPYCEDDYHQLYSPRCAYCNGPILDKCVTALDTNFHPEHFFCAHCGKQFGQEGFHEKDGKPYCRTDYLALFAPKCGGCSKPITDNYITALNAQWHPECFVCRDCKSSFAGTSFYTVEGKPVCGKCLGVTEDDDEEEEEGDE
ncbi:transforming growth factor beta-1-induced transcript 1 protein isoform X2 [Folsomia candida]|uniref:Paxillin n=1 Tax=Folsomia candida TaxID=158441 RepID=A0A226E648_FOLCA|nr:transforming growth factor beta-1-induced transcript 1 protein isoform X2 [Folsomia candida]OXA52524.1 Paxillin [Folsomia candida]